MGEPSHLLFRLTALEAVDSLNPNQRRIFVGDKGGNLCRKAVEGCFTGDPAIANSDGIADAPGNKIRFRRGRMGAGYKGGILNLDPKLLHMAQDGQTL